MSPLLTNQCPYCDRSPCRCQAADQANEASGARQNSGVERSRADVDGELAESAGAEPEWATWWRALAANA